MSLLASLHGQGLGSSTTTYPSINSIIPNNSKESFQTSNLSNLLSSLTNASSSSINPSSSNLLAGSSQPVNAVHLPGNNTAGGFQPGPSLGSFAGNSASKIDAAAAAMALLEGLNTSISPPSSGSNSTSFSSSANLVSSNNLVSGTTATSLLANLHGNSNNNAFGDLLSNLSDNSSVVFGSSISNTNQTSLLSNFNSNSNSVAAFPHTQQQQQPPTNNLLSALSIPLSSSLVQQVRAAIKSQNNASDPQQTPLAPVGSANPTLVSLLEGLKNSSTSSSTSTQQPSKRPDPRLKPYPTGGKYGSPGTGKTDQGFADRTSYSAAQGRSYQPPSIAPDVDAKPAVPLPPIKITAQVLAEVARMAEETNVFDVMKKLYVEQTEKEQFLLSQRKLLEKKHEKRRDVLMADEIIGKLTPARQAEEERMLSQELSNFDLFMMREMEGLWRRHQVEMEKARVPLFRETDKGEEIQVQRKVVEMLVDTMPEATDVILKYDIVPSCSFMIIQTTYTDPTFTPLSNRYLKEKNRPYSANDIFQNLKGEYPKTLVTKVLTNLVEEGRIHGKANGKQWVYCPKQEQGDLLSAEDLGKVEEDLKRVTAELEVLRGEIASTMSRLAQLRQGEVVISEAERKRISKEYNMYRGLWKQRKKLFKDAWNMITENLPGKPQELMETLGIETDEMVGVDFNLDPLDIKRK
ncbi:hypothetical protein HDU97_001563 [Phlyctochytrium planicorne]|nr:hypothetical protein HDU97_001563 [Phlyctochytrium planicorne]